MTTFYNLEQGSLLWSIVICDLGNKGMESNTIGSDLDYIVFQHSKLLNAQMVAIRF